MRKNENFLIKTKQNEAKQNKKSNIKKTKPNNQK